MCCIALLRSEVQDVLMLSVMCWAMPRAESRGSRQVGKKWYYSTGGSAKHLSTNGKAEDMRKLKSAKW